MTAATTTSLSEQFAGCASSERMKCHWFSSEAVTASEALQSCTFRQNNRSSDHDLHKLDRTANIQSRIDVPHFPARWVSRLRRPTLLHYGDGHHSIEVKVRRSR